MSAKEQALHREIDRAFAQSDIGSAIAQLDTLLLASPHDIDGWMKMAALQRANNQLTDAMRSIDKALAIDPLFYLALLFKGTLLQTLGSPAKAAEFLAAALFHANGQTPSPTIARQLAAARHMIDRHAMVVAEQTRNSATISPAERERSARIVDRLADNVVRRRPVFHQEPTHYRYPGLADVEFFEDFRPEWLELLESNTAAIRREYEALVAINHAVAQPYIDLSDGYPVGPWAGLNRSRDWKAVHLIRYGEIVEENARHCPETMRLLAHAARPHIAGLAPNVMFSVLAPGTRIPPHHGVANFRAVMHLPLIVPDACRFRVGAETRYWELGRAWVFDDTIEHEAWNDSDQPRIILIADVWRPELDALERRIVQSFMQSIGADPDLGSL